MFEYLYGVVEYKKMDYVALDIKKLKWERNINFLFIIKLKKMLII